MLPAHKKRQTMKIFFPEHETLKRTCSGKESHSPWLPLQPHIEPEGSDWALRQQIGREWLLHPPRHLHSFSLFSDCKPDTYLSQNKKNMVGENFASSIQNWVPACINFKFKYTLASRTWLQLPIALPYQRQCYILNPFSECFVTLFLSWHCWQFLEFFCQAIFSFVWIQLIILLSLNSDVIFNTCLGSWIFFNSCILLYNFKTILLPTLFHLLLTFL